MVSFTDLLALCNRSSALTSDLSGHKSKKPLVLGFPGCTETWHHGPIQPPSLSGVAANTVTGDGTFVLLATNGGCGALANDSDSGSRE